MNCPRCKESVLRKSIIKEKDQQVEHEICDDCQGIWFPANKLSKLDQIVEPVLIEFRSIPTEYEQLTPLYCPSCTPPRLMEKHAHSRDSKVIMDVCPSCRGIWLDHGELDAIQQQSLFSLLFDF